MPRIVWEARKTANILTWTGKSKWAKYVITKTPNKPFTAILYGFNNRIRDFENHNNLNSAKNWCFSKDEEFEELDRLYPPGNTLMIHPDHVR